ncbi:hypothetical protein BDB00DRAFT_935035 [Zychaea mexicana]|uniref:uncharacterized protein n=1 Tax=Zychaea mexicana TaxID=64656 RepID=UPI0022FEE60A|nr:uncharacterized protein BDB00DRAFT_935035 [Zychaea mexicana]KAI9499293.1 hypothetical protein BDB00DRAFT_935035 [Zychaea mexicana]
MVESNKRNSLTFPFGLRIPGRSNSVKSSSTPPSHTPTAKRTSSATTTISNQQQQQYTMSAPPLERPPSSNSFHLARGINNNSATHQQQPVISDSDEERVKTPASPTGSPNTISNNEVPESPTARQDSESLNYVNISVDVQAGPKNRAQAIIDRFGAWQIILREILIWLEQVGRINLQSSELYYHKVLPHVDWNDSSVKRGTPMASILYGFRSLTARVASTQHSAGNKLLNEYIPELEALAKECKRKTQTLDQDRQFRMDELLRRADTTQKTISLLSKQCQAAASTGGHVSQDPWLTNLHVLRYLQREIQEDNRLRTAIIDIQHQSALFEKRIIHALKKAAQFCYDHYGNIAVSRETARIQRMIEKMDTEREWQQFLSSEARDLVVDEVTPSRNYLFINYSNKFHPAVMTLAKGNLERRTGGIRKQYTKRYYVLTQCGFLHQFHENDKVNPELSIFIPRSTVIPSIDISHLAHDEHGGNYTVEIRRSAALQRDKVYILKASSREELVAWCRLLVDIATRNHGHSATWKKIQRKSMLPGDNDDPTTGTLRIDTTSVALQRLSTNAGNGSRQNNGSSSARRTSQAPLSAPMTVDPPVTTTVETTTDGAADTSFSSLGSPREEYSTSVSQLEEKGSKATEDDNSRDRATSIPDKGKGRIKEIIEAVVEPIADSAAPKETAVVATILRSNETASLKAKAEDRHEERDDQKTPTKETGPILLVNSRSDQQVELPPANDEPQRHLTPPLGEAKDERKDTTTNTDESNAKATEKEGGEITNLEKQASSDDSTGKSSPEAKRSSTALMYFVSYLPQLNNTFSTAQSSDQPTTTASNRNSNQSFQSLPEQPSSSEETTSRQ